MDEKLRTKIEALVDKASDARDPVQALNFSQAACNAANAMRVLAEIPRSGNAPQTSSQKRDT